LGQSPFPQAPPGGFIANDAVNSFKLRGRESFSKLARNCFHVFAPLARLVSKARRTCWEDFGLKLPSLI
jgi:hypothetical protein